MRYLSDPYRCGKHSRDSWCDWIDLMVNELSGGKGWVWDRAGVSRSSGWSLPLCPLSWFIPLFQLIVSKSCTGETEAKGDRSAQSPSNGTVGGSQAGLSSRSLCPLPCPCIVLRARPSPSPVHNQPITRHGREACLFRTFPEICSFRDPVHWNLRPAVSLGNITEGCLPGLTMSCATCWSAKVLGV